MESSTVTIQLPTSLYNELQALAADEQTDLVEVIARLVALAEQRAGLSKPPTRAFHRILERATDLGITDLSEQHDHYLYGLEKQ
jgi:hypothetical protein